MSSPRKVASAQAGFSMVELMMVAVIMAIGLLGLTMLQAVSLSSGGTSKNRNTATLLGQRILDQVEAEGRVTWLNVSSSTQATPGAVPNLLYFPLAGVPSNITQYFDFFGNPLASATGSTFKTVTNGVAVANLASTGFLADVTVTVTFNDSPVNGQTVSHTVTLTRRVIHD